MKDLYAPEVVDAVAIAILKAELDYSKKDVELVWNTISDMGRDSYRRIAREAIKAMLTASA